MGTSSHFARSQFLIGSCNFEVSESYFFHFEHIQDVFGSWVILRKNQSRRFWNSDIIIFLTRLFWTDFFSGHTKFTFRITSQQQQQQQPDSKPWSTPTTKTMQTTSPSPKRPIKTNSGGSLIFFQKNFHNAIQSLHPPLNGVGFDAVVVVVVIIVVVVV